MIGLFYTLMLGAMTCAIIFIAALPFILAARELRDDFRRWRRGPPPPPRAMTRKELDAYCRAVDEDCL